MIFEILTAIEAIVLWAIVIKAFMEIRKGSMLLLGLGFLCLIAVETAEHFRDGFVLEIRPLWHEFLLTLGYGLILFSIFKARKEITSG